MDKEFEKKKTHLTNDNVPRYESLISVVLVYSGFKKGNFCVAEGNVLLSYHVFFWLIL